MKKILLAFLFNACLGPVFGQGPEGSFEWVAQDKRFFRASVTDIEQDNQGGIWMATSQGLNYFDGIDAINFRTQQRDTNSIQANHISRIFINDNDLWIGYSQGGLSVLNIYTKKIEHLHLQMPVGEVSAITRIGSNIFIGIVGAGAFLISPERKVVDSINLSPHINKIYSPRLRWSYNTISDAVEHDGMLYLATHDGLYRYDQRNRLLQPIRVTNEIFHRKDLFNAIIKDGKSGFWLCGWQSGLTHYDPATNTSKNYQFAHEENEMFNNIIYSVALNKKDSNELFLASADRGFGTFNIAKAEFSFLPKENNIYQRKMPSTQAYKIFCDREGAIWLGCDLGIGIFHRADPAIQFHKVNVEVSSNGLYYGMNAQFLNKKRQLLFLTTSNADGLQIIDLKRNRQSHLPFKVLPTEEATQHATAMVEIGVDSLLVSTRDYLLLLDEKKLQWLDFPQPAVIGKGSSRFRKMLKGKNNLVWISSGAAGMFSLDLKTKTYKNYSHDPNNVNSVVDNNIQDFSFDSDGNLWIASLGVGISKYYQDRQSFVTYNDYEFGVRNILVDKYGKIWLAGTSGVKAFTLDGDKVLWIDKFNSGIFTEPVSRLATDTAGNIFTFTSIGLLKINSESLQIETLPFSDQFRIIENISAQLAVVDGVLNVNTLQGYFTIDINKAEFIKHAPPELKIKSMEVLGEPFLVDLSKLKDELNLRYFQNSFTIQYGIGSLREADRIIYSYYLDGSDKNWNYAGSRNYVTFKDLAPGNYDFRIRASDPLSDWQLEASILKIKIDSPFWRTWWFYTLTCIFLVAAAYVGFRFKVRQVRKAEKFKADTNEKVTKSQIRALQAQMNPHFIFNCLNSIDYFILESKPLAASEYLAKFSKLIRLFLEELNEEFISLSKEIQTIDLYLQLEQLRFSTKLTYKIETESLDKESLFLPTMIIQPFVENAIIHGIQPLKKTGFIYIRFFAEDDRLVCVIRDNGVGRKNIQSDDFRKRKSYGIGLSSLRLSLIQPQSSIDIVDLHDPDGQPSGTEVIIKFLFLAKTD